MSPNPNFDARLLRLSLASPRVKDKSTSVPNAQFSTSTAQAVPSPWMQQVSRDQASRKCTYAGPPFGDDASVEEVEPRFSAKMAAEAKRAGKIREICLK